MSLGEWMLESKMLGCLIWTKRKRRTNKGVEDTV